MFRKDGNLEFQKAYSGIKIMCLRNERFVSFWCRNFMYISFEGEIFEKEFRELELTLFSVESMRLCPNGIMHRIIFYDPFRK